MITVEVSRLDVTPNPAPLGAELNLEARSHALCALIKRPTRHWTRLTFTPVPSRPHPPLLKRRWTSCDARIVDARWNVIYVVDMSSARHILEVRASVRFRSLVSSATVARRALSPPSLGLPPPSLTEPSRIPSQVGSSEKTTYEAGKSTLVFHADGIEIEGVKSSMLNNVGLLCATLVDGTGEEGGEGVHGDAGDEVAGRTGAIDHQPDRGLEVGIDPNAGTSAARAGFREGGESSESGLPRPSRSSRV